MSATVIADSIWECERLTTMEVVLPRVVLAEFNTHRAFSRNSASSRALPFRVMRATVAEDPYIPYMGAYAPGMSDAGHEVVARQQAIGVWRDALDSAIAAHCELEALGVSKQVANRLLEPWMHTRVLVTGVTSAYEHFFALRCGEDADPAIQAAARSMRDAYLASAPVPRTVHAPYHADEVRSVAACARVSYLRRGADPDADIALYERLRANGHWSPFEHFALAQDGPPRNFRAPWVQARVLRGG